MQTFEYCEDDGYEFTRDDGSVVYLYGYCSGEYIRYADGEIEMISFECEEPTVYDDNGRELNVRLNESEMDHWERYMQEKLDNTVNNA